MSQRTEPVQMRILPDNMTTYAARDTISFTLINSLSGAVRDTFLATVSEEEKDAFPPPSLNRHKRTRA